MGEKITMTGNGLRVPANPVIPFIEGDGIGRGRYRSRYLEGGAAGF